MDAQDLRLEDSDRIYVVLSAEERDELLQRLLVAAPRGGEEGPN